MNPLQEIRTERLCLRRWLLEDRAPFAALNADPRVVEFLPGPLTREESHALADRIEAHFQRHGFGLWAVEIPGIIRFAGFIGLSIPSFEAPFTPCVEIGWRLDPEQWNRGYATEGARAALEFGFVSLQLDEIVSFTVPGNLRSRRVMEKIGMTRSAGDDFGHPALPEGHPLRRHVLYRVARPRSAERSKRETAMSFTIREATAADVPALADLHVRTWNATYPDCPKKPTYEIRERQLEMILDTVLSASPAEIEVYLNSE